MSKPLISAFILGFYLSRVFAAANESARVSIAADRLVPEYLARCHKSEVPRAICQVNDRSVAVATEQVVRIWEFSDPDGEVRCKASARIMGVQDLHYLPHRDVLLCAGDDLYAWHLLQNEVDVIGNVIPNDSEIRLNSDDISSIVPTDDDQWIVGASLLPKIARTDELGDAKAQAVELTSGSVAWRTAGSELLIVEDLSHDGESEAIFLRNLNGLTLGPRISQFRVTHDETTREFTSDPTAQVRIDEPPVGSTVDPFIGLETVTDGKHIFLSLGASTGVSTVPIYEIWNVTEPNRCNLVSWFTQSELGREHEHSYAIGLFGVCMKESENSIAHFILILDDGLVDIIPSPEFARPSVSDLGFLPFPKINSDVGKVSTAAVSRDGQRIVTGHLSGHIVIWRYTPITREQ